MQIGFGCEWGMANLRRYNGLFLFHFGKVFERLFANRLKNHVVSRPSSKPIQVRTCVGLNHYLHFINMSPTKNNIFERSRSLLLDHQSGHRAKNWSPLPLVLSELDPFFGTCYIFLRFDAVPKCHNGSNWWIGGCSTSETEYTSTHQRAEAVVQERLNTPRHGWILRVQQGKGQVW